MDLSYPPELVSFRRETVRLVDSLLPPDWKGIGYLDSDEVSTFLSDWRRKLAENGLLGVDWPTTYGGQGLSSLHAVVVADVLGERNVPVGTENDIHAFGMVGPTMLHFGTAQQKEYFLPRMISGEHVWCQGFSEPGAGSDIAALKTRADLVDERWVITGSKIWTSAAMTANWVFLLVRTERDSRRHRGLTMLLVPLDQPGIDIRPIRDATGGYEFNEVFYEGATTSSANALGPVGEGWSVAMALLGFERGLVLPTTVARFRNELDRLWVTARDAGRLDDPVFRQRLADVETTFEAIRYLAMRIETSAAMNEVPGAEASLAKLLWSTFRADVMELGVDALGEEALVIYGRRPHSAFQVDDPGTPNSTVTWTNEFLSSQGTMIAGGPSEVQRTIIAERTLGLPRMRR